MCGAYFFCRLGSLRLQRTLRDFALKHSEDLREEIGGTNWSDQSPQLAIPFPPISRQLRHPRRRLWRARRNRVYSDLPTIASADQHDQFSMATRLPIAAAFDLIVIGSSREWADRNFTACRVAGHIGDSLGVENEENDVPPTSLYAVQPRQPWPVFWKDHERFG